MLFGVGVIHVVCGGDVIDVHVVVRGGGGHVIVGGGVDGVAVLVVFVVDALVYSCCC